MDSTDVASPGFGALGLLFANKYGGIQDDIRNCGSDAIKTVENWIDALETIKKNWRAAEDASTVVYQ